jgi:hypothetical protein
VAVDPKRSQKVEVLPTLATDHGLLTIVGRADFTKPFGILIHLKSGVLVEGVIILGSKSFAIGSAIRAKDIQLNSIARRHTGFSSRRWAILI